MILLSICISTYNRADYIYDTLLSITEQLTVGVEILILDGASTDHTEDVVQRVASNCSSIRYIRESINSGIDRDFNKAIVAARGTYCWLLSDDDLVRSGAIERILIAIQTEPSLLIVNAAIRNHDLTTLLHPSLLPTPMDRLFQSSEGDDFLSCVGHALSFIGCVVIRRERWLGRNASIYFGSLFIHVGVILQSPPLARVMVIGEPLVDIRYGNAMWSARGFEIWMFMWPKLIWSFPGYSTIAKNGVTAEEPWRQFRKLVLFRGIGGYSKIEYNRLIKPNTKGLFSLCAMLISVAPAKFVNALASLYCLTINRNATSGAYDLMRSVNSTWISRAVAKRLTLGHK